MTTEDDAASANLEKLNANLAKVEDLSQRLVAALANRSKTAPGLSGPGHELYMKAATACIAELMSNPARIIEHQVDYWGKSLKHYIEAQQALLQGKLDAPEDHTPEDRRFSAPIWQSHPYFNFVKQQYMLNAQAVEGAIQDIDNVDPKDKQRIEFFSRQILDLFSPTNFLGTNPEALAKAVETNGQSLVDGLENLVRDVEASSSDLQITLADKDAFEVGGNLATTEGKVVFRNWLFELIQYSPRTETVHKTPLLIFPPWINKYYIMDLKPQNSLIKWIVEQGVTLFVVSWRNPDVSFADAGIDTYIKDGFLTAIDHVKAITDELKINVIGYCIAGTMLNMVIAYLAKKGDNSINSATFFTTLTDFMDQGEFTPFLSNDFVDGIEKECNEKGLLDSCFMSRTFSYLRANDLIYAPAIRSYMMGEAPPAFDLLFWNGDSTNMPARMTVEYLRWLCQDNLLAKGEVEVLGEKLSLSDVKVPFCAIACETDHIAAWKSSYNGLRRIGSESRMFILSQSGHIAGIINPPSRKKYGHYTNESLGQAPEDWLDGAEFHEGSWWPRWGQWLAKRSGDQVSARMPGDSDHPALADAPGTYVVEEKSE